MKKKAEYLSVEGDEVVINTNFNWANADPIRAGRLARSGTKEDLEKLKEMENTPMYSDTEDE